MKNNFTHISTLILVVLFINFNEYAQFDSSKTIDKKRLEFSPAVHGVQIDGNIFFISYEFGGQIDFDLFQSRDNICLGTRLSVEHYTTGDFGGTTSGSPFTNYNLYLRFSQTLNNFSINFLGGTSYYNSSEPDYFPSKGLPIKIRENCRNNS